MLVEAATSLMLAIRVPEFLQPWEALTGLGTLAWAARGLLLRQVLAR